MRREIVNATVGNKKIRIFFFLIRKTLCYYVIVSVVVDKITYPRRSDTFVVVGIETYLYYLINWYNFLFYCLFISKKTHKKKKKKEVQIYFLIICKNTGIKCNNKFNNVGNI